MFQGPDIKEKWLISVVICQPGGHTDQAWKYLSLVKLGKPRLLTLYISDQIFVRTDNWDLLCIGPFSVCQLVTATGLSILVVSTLSWCYMCMSSNCYL